jgi:hypothetical protein
MDMVRSCATALTVLLVAGSAAHAQSLTSVRGPGHPVTATDARTMALDGLGIGLHGFAATFANPAAVAMARRRGAVVVLENVERTVRFGGESDNIGTTRFPLINVVFPARGVVFTGGYGSYLDQSWALVREGEQPLGDATVEYFDVMESVGGVGRLQFGAAVPIGETLGVGATVGLHMGGQRVDYSRQFDTRLDSPIEPYIESMSWRYRGPVAQVGAVWNPSDILRLGGSVTWAGTLVGDSVEGRSPRRELDLPLQVAGGASGFLVPGLLASMSARWSGWSVTEAGAIGVHTGDFAPSSRDTWEVGGGMEWARARPGVRRTYPLRIGAQYRQLPFGFIDEAPAEWLVGGGTGLVIGDPVSPLGLVDLTVQRGSRTAAGPAAVGSFTENMWRIALSVSLFGS